MVPKPLCPSLQLFSTFSGVGRLLFQLLSAGLESASFLKVLRGHLAQFFGFQHSPRCGQGPGVPEGERRHLASRAQPTYSKRYRLSLAAP